LGSNLIGKVIVGGQRGLVVLRGGQNRLFYPTHGSLKIMFPTLFAMYKIALTLPVGSVETERSFSKLKIIKNRLRSTMSNDRLELLMRINCEQDIDINYTCVIDKFSLKSLSLIKNLTF
jgi:hypothetical protein